MAYTLKNTGVAAQVAWVLAVDDDSAMKGWKTPGAAADWTVGAGLTLGGSTSPSVVSGEWKTVSRNLIRLPTSGQITIDTAIAVSDPFCFFVVTRNSTQTDGGVLIRSAATSTGSYDSTKPVVASNSAPQPVLRDQFGAIALSYPNRTFSGTEAYSMFLQDNTPGNDNESFFSLEADSITGVAFNRSGYGTDLNGFYFRIIGGTDPAWTGDIVCIGALQGLISQSNAASIHSDPIGTLFSSGSTNYTLTAAQGTYTLSGQAAALRAGKTLSVASGTYSLSGQTTSLLDARKLSAAQGSYSLSGQDATLTYTQPGVYSLTADSGTYNWTVSDAFADYTMVALHGTYDLTGQDATLTLTGAPPQDYVMSVDAGYYSLTGRAAALRWSGAPIVPSSGKGLSLSMRIGL